MKDLTAYLRGLVAGGLSKALKLYVPNPYSRGSDDSRLWSTGWSDGHAEADKVLDTLGAAGMVGGEIPSPVGAVGAPVSPHETPAAPAPTLSVEPEALFDE